MGVTRVSLGVREKAVKQLHVVLLTKTWYTSRGTGIAKGEL